jgi:hypothetical protein
VLGNVLDQFCFIHKDPLVGSGVRRCLFKFLMYWPSGDLRNAGMIQGSQHNTATAFGTARRRILDVNLRPSRAL